MSGAWCQAPGVRSQGQSKARKREKVALWGALWPLPGVSTFLRRFFVLIQIPALSPLGERVDHTGVLFSRCGPGERVFARFDVTRLQQLPSKVHNSELLLRPVSSRISESEFEERLASDGEGR